MFMLLLLKLSQGVQVMYLDICVQQSRLNLDNVHKNEKYGKLLRHLLILIHLLVYGSFPVNDLRIISIINKKLM